MERNKKIKYILMILAAAVVFICGIYGFMKYEECDFINALYYTIRLFLGDGGVYTTDLWFNIARYGALLVSATFVVSLIDRIADSIHDFIVWKKGDSIFVYGENDLVREFMSAAKNRSRIINRKDFKQAGKYVLLSDDGDNLDFYQSNIESLQSKDVYIRNNTFANTLIGKHRFFSIEQLAARKFWREHSLIDLAFDENGMPKEELHISIIGSGTLAESLLYESLITNIYDADQRVIYYVFGDWSYFQKTHNNSERLNVVYCSDFLIEKETITKSDVVLFLQNEEKLHDLIGCISRANLVLFTEKDLNESLLSVHVYGENKNLIVQTYNYLDKVCTEYEIIDERSISNAKKLNAAYNANNHLEEGLSVDEQWQKLSAFHKASNIACVDYYTFTIVKLLEKRMGKSYEAITDEEFNDNIESLSELEHIRWCNFHLFCNWEYDDHTNKSIKKHNSLVPYDELSREEQIKDVDQLYEIRDMLKSR